MAHVSESCIDYMNTISRRRWLWMIWVMVAPNQCLINTSNYISHNTIDDGEDEEETDGLNHEMVDEDSSNNIDLKDAEGE